MTIINKHQSALIAQQMAELRQQNTNLLVFLVALIKEKHQGRAFVSASTIAEVTSKPYNLVPHDNTPLGNYSLTVHLNGSPCVDLDATPPQIEKPAADQPAKLLVAPEQIAAEPEPETRCAHCSRKIGHNLDCPARLSEVGENAASEAQSGTDSTGTCC